MGGDGLWCVCVSVCVCVCCCVVCVYIYIYMSVCVSVAQVQKPQPQHHIGGHEYCQRHPPQHICIVPCTVSTLSAVHAVQGEHLVSSGEGAVALGVCLISAGEGLPLEGEVCQDVGAPGEGGEEAEVEEGQGHIDGDVACHDSE
jgi:hypothetical protein